MALDFLLVDKDGNEHDTDFRIGYGSFGWLRRKLAFHLGDEFAQNYNAAFECAFNPQKAKELEDWSGRFFSDHPEHQPILSALFYHSDCDGEWNREEIDLLIKWLSEHTIPKETDPEKRDFDEERLGLLEMLQTPDIQKIIFC